jgi:hypothetical protein
MSDRDQGRRGETRPGDEHTDVIIEILDFALNRLTILQIEHSTDTS